MASLSDNHTHAEIIGRSILLASIQSSIGSVEMSSKFSVLSFAKDQDTLQRAADALTSYIIVGVIWTIGSGFTLYAEFGRIGLIYGIIANVIMMLWIIISYWRAFQYATRRNNLQMPSLFSSIEHTPEEFSQKEKR